MQYPVIFLCQMPWSVGGVAGAVPGRCKVIFLQTLALLPAGMSRWLSCTVQHWTLPHLSQGNTLPNLLDLFEGGVGLSWPGDKKKKQQRERKLWSCPICGLVCLSCVICAHYCILLWWGNCFTISLDYAVPAGDFDSWDQMQYLS